MKRLLIGLAFVVAAYGQIIISGGGAGGGGGGGAVTCGSTDKTVCYNNAGAFAGDANLTWDATTGLAALKPVGFGTAAPTTWDSLVGNNIATLAGIASNVAAGKSQNLMFRSAGAGGSDASHITAVASRGTLASPAVVDGGDIVLDQRYYAYNGAAFNEVAALQFSALGSGMGAGKSGEVYIQALNQTGSGSSGTYLDLYADPNIGQFAQLQSDFIILKGTNGAEVDFDDSGGLVSSRPITTGTKAFAALGSPSNGAMVNCSDCTVTSGVDDTCAASGGGAFAERIAGAWKCHI